MTKRNQNVDMLRGIAMLMVVLGHTMTKCTEHSQDSLLFNIVWTLQMPLFMLISGYTNCFSRPVGTAGDLGTYAARRTVAYLLPWMVWTFVIRGVIFSGGTLPDPVKVLWNMDDGYWFLFSIWQISLAFGVARLVACKFCKSHSGIRYVVLCGVVYVVMMALVAVQGIVFGMSFLGTKLTLYYMPFYFAGFLFGQIQQPMLSRQYGKTAMEAVIGICVIVYLVLLTRFSFYSVPDSPVFIILRAVASLTGCAALCGLLGAQTWGTGIVGKALGWVGVHSLEIYLLHYIVLVYICPGPPLAFESWGGACAVVGCFGATVMTTGGIVWLLRRSSVLSLMLFGKKS
jgi:fucose 4-O-acetylase-like acetyltransferase